MTDMTDLPAELNCKTVQKLSAEDEIIILDVREHWEYEQGHIPGARLIPLGRLPHHINEIPEDKEVALVCERGIRSAQAQRLLIDEGFDNVHNMLGGMVTWRDRGYKVET
jgi:rhodanese-related sulfurtransferase